MHIASHNKLVGCYDIITTKYILWVPFALFLLYDITPYYLATYLWVNKVQGLDARECFPPMNSINYGAVQPKV